MNKNDFKLIGYLGTILGALFLAGGVFTLSYYEMYSIPECLCLPRPRYPYAQDSGSLLVTGILTLLIGLLCLWRTRYEAKNQNSVPKVPKQPEGSAR